jgi:AbrB family looped-hinge helix DNA binding protein
MVDRGEYYNYNNNCMESLYMTKVRQLGDSHGIVIPKPVLKAMNFKRGDLLVFIMDTDDTITLRRLSDKQIREIKERAAIIKMK